MRKWVLVLGCVVLVAVMGAAFVGVRQRVEEERSAQRQLLESTRQDLVGERQELGLLWNEQLDHLNAVEPTGRVGTEGHAVSGLYLARIVSVDPAAAAITFDWLGVSAQDGRATNGSVVTQRMELASPLASVLVQVPTRRDVSGPTGPATVPATLNPATFFDALRSDDTTGAAYRKSAWWVATDSERHCSLLMQSQLPAAAE